MNAFRMDDKTWWASKCHVHHVNCVRIRSDTQNAWHSNEMLAFKKIHPLQTQTHTKYWSAPFIPKKIRKMQHILRICAREKLKIWNILLKYVFQEKQIYIKRGKSEGNSKRIICVYLFHSYLFDANAPHSNLFKKALHCIFFFENS